MSSNLAVAIIGLVLALAPKSPSQAVSPIGDFLPEYWGGIHPGPVTMTADGEWIVAVESYLITCYPPYYERIVRVRSDGTQREVLFDEDQMFALAGNKLTDTTFMRLSGDGSWAYFVRPGGWIGQANCEYVLPSHGYLLDLRNGVVKDLAPDGLVSGAASWTDDGRTMAFSAIDPVSGNKVLFYVGGPDGTGATPFLDTSQWSYARGIISGDGSRFVFIVEHDNLDDDVMIYDFRTGGVTKLTPSPIKNDVVSANCSADGERIVYGIESSTVSNASVYAVYADGSGHRKLHDGALKGTITRDGEWVFIEAGSFYRVSWDGSVVELLTGTTGWPGEGVNSIKPAAIDATGSRAAFFTTIVPLGPSSPLAVWHEHTPVLTTYGYGAPGTPLRFDIGGEPGDSFLLASSPLSAHVPFRPWGVLELDPSRLVLLAGGVVGDWLNIGSVELQLPPDVWFAMDVPVHFQALVQHPGGGGALTNATTFVFPSTMVVTTPPVPGTQTLLDVRARAEELRRRATRPPTREDVWRQRRMMDPTLEWTRPWEREQSRSR